MLYRCAFLSFAVVQSRLTAQPTSLSLSLATGCLLTDRYPPIFALLMRFSASWVSFGYTAAYFMLAVTCLQTFLVLFYLEAAKCEVKLKAYEKFWRQFASIAAQLSIVMYRH